MRRRRGSARVRKSQSNNTHPGLTVIAIARIPDSGNGATRLDPGASFSRSAAAEETTALTVMKAAI